MESVGGSGWESPTVEEDGNEVALTSFEGVTLYPRLQRRPGMEKEDVLAEPADGDSGILENIATKYVLRSTVYSDEKLTTYGISKGIRDVQEEG
jgi:hypothetical protein